MQAMHTTPTIFVPSQQRLHKLRFLQKLGCQKPCWDQAKLSSRVDKQVVTLDAGESECGGLGQTDTQTDGQFDMVTYRLNLPRGRVE